MVPTKDTKSEKNYFDLRHKQHSFVVIFLLSNNLQAFKLHHKLRKICYFLGYFDVLCNLIKAAALNPPKSVDEGSALDPGPSAPRLSYKLVGLFTCSAVLNCGLRWSKRDEINEFSSRQ